MDYRSQPETERSLAIRGVFPALNADHKNLIRRHYQAIVIDKLELDRRLFDNKADILTVESSILALTRKSLCNVL
jgi:hypothetical protein